MNASPLHALSFPPGYPSLPVPPETVLALLRQLDAAEQDWEAQAAVAVLDPALAFELLAALPAPVPAAGLELRSLLAQRMSRIGPELLRAWCLDRLAVPGGRGQPACGLKESLHGLFVAELALHLAVETKQGSFQDAYVAGLLHDVGQLWFSRHAGGYAEVKSEAAAERALSATELGRYGIGHGGLGGALVARCGLPEPVADAIHLHHCPREAIADAAALPRMVWLAEEIAGARFEVSDHDLSAAAQLSGLDAAALSALRADVARRVASITKQQGIPAAAESAQGQPGRWMRHDALPAATVGALVRAALLEPDAAPGSRVAAACRLLLDLGTPLLLEYDPGASQLLGIGDDERPWAAGLRFVAGGSTVFGSLNGAVAQQCVFRPQGPEHSAADWQLARRLAATGLLCEPWAAEGRRGVAVFALAGDYADDRIRAAARRAVVAGAVAGHLRRQRAQDIRREAEQALRARYREHYRRLAHEATNPLSVMKSYIAVIRQRAGEGAALDAALDTTFALLDAELDRVAAMLRAAAVPPEAPPDAGEQTVDVAGLLEDLRRLYAAVLFGARGIAFDLDAGRATLRGRIPRDALKQVLLNLFKNASEALAAGGRFSVSVIPAANLGGVACLGIRLADDGGGIGPGAMAGLFERSASSKGGEHQGVGLVVVRETLARYGAAVVCESERDTGSVFRVYIPLAEPT